MDPIVINVLVFLVLGLVLGILLTIAAKVFSVETDPRVAAVREALPGANCGACGEVGCDNFAAAVVEGRKPVNGCPVGGEQSASALAEILGIEVDLHQKPMTARVRCTGGPAVSKEKYKYVGILDCFAASQVFAGHKACQYGCLGHGTCAKVCPFGAIDMIDGVAVINEDKCKACEKCVSACPKHLIEMVEKGKDYSVLCRSADKGAAVRTYCEVGCIGCTRCVKACPEGAISMQGPLAYIDFTKCVNCGACETVCPTHAIGSQCSKNSLKAAANQ
jgi:RnfABCDGE-type electron transport complex B subunit